MRLSLLTETVKELLEYNHAYDKHKAEREKMLKLHRDKWGRAPEKEEAPQYDPEKVKLYQAAAGYLSKYIGLNDQRKKIIWSKVLEMNSDTEYWLKSYMDQGEQGWHDVKEFLLPGGFQE